MPPPPPLPTQFLSVSALSLGLEAFEAITAAIHGGTANSRATFECVMWPRHEGYMVFAGLEPLLDALERFRLKSEELSWLESVGAIDAKVKQRLTDAKFTCDVDGAPEGSVVFPGEPVVVVEGPYWQAQLIAAWVLSAIDNATQTASVTARCVLAADGAEIIEAGSIYGNRLGGNPLLARAAYIGGAGATTHALAGKRYGVPVRARQPISYVLSQGDERKAFETWLRSVPEQPILRLDSQNALEAVGRAVDAARSKDTASWSDAPIAIDIGDKNVVETADAANERFAKSGLKPPVILVSGRLDAARIDELRRTRAPIAAFVVEPRVDDDPIGRYELVAVEEGGQWSPRLRLGESASHSNVPGRKVVLRYFDADGHPVGDASHATNERHLAPRDARLVDLETGYLFRLKDAVSSSQLLIKLMRAGKRVAVPEPTSESRDRALRSLRSMHERHRRLVHPDAYPCGVTPNVAKSRLDLITRAHE